MSRAACKGTATTDSAGDDPFFPGRGGTSEKAILGFCIKCSVRKECSTYADDIDAKVGIWGGKRRTRATHGPLSERRPNERRAA